MGLVHISGLLLGVFFATSCSAWFCCLVTYYVLSTISFMHFGARWWSSYRV